MFVIIKHCNFLSLSLEKKTICRSMTISYWWYWDIKFHICKEQNIHSWKKEYQINDKDNKEIHQRLKVLNRYEF